MTEQPEQPRTPEDEFIEAVGDLQVQPDPMYWRGFRDGQARAAQAAASEQDRWSPDEEHCHKCGRPVGVVWTAPDKLWQAVMGTPGGIRCIRCFDEEAEAQGRFIRWVPREEPREGAAAPEQDEAVRLLESTYIEDEPFEFLHRHNDRQTMRHTITDLCSELRVIPAASPPPAPVALDVERLARYEEHVGGLHCPEYHGKEGTCEWQERCDEPGCVMEATNGFPSPTGYRRTCSTHGIALRLARQSEDQV